MKVKLNMAAFLNRFTKSGYQEPEKANKKAKGFSLIELMIVLVIIGILATLAYPTYINQVRKGRRADAQAALYDLAQSMERYYTAANDYSTATLGNGGIFPNALPKDRTQKFYKLLIDEETSQNYYKVTAVAIADTVQAGDACPSLWLDSIGNTGAQKQGIDVADCW